MRPFVLIAILAGYGLTCVVPALVGCSEDSAPTPSAHPSQNAPERRADDDPAPDRTPHSDTSTSEGDPQEIKASGERIVQGSPGRTSVRAGRSNAHRVVR